MLKFKPSSNIQNTRGIAVVNNQKVKFTEFTVEKNGFSAADSFEVVLPFFIRKYQSGETVLANGDNFQSALVSQDSLPVQVYVGYPQNPSKYDINDLTQIMDGFIDVVRWNFDINGEFVTLNGRNIVGKMIDAKIVDKYPNMTSSSIANMFASKYGLTAVITPTGTLAGTYYNSNSTLMGTTDTSEWDLLIFLAKQEDFIVRVKNNTLYFGPYSEVIGYENKDPLVYTWGSNIETLEIERSPHAARDIVVKVISFDRNNKNKIIETASSSGQDGTKEKYIETYTIPGLTRDQAQKKASAIYEELSRSQLIGQITCSGNTDMVIDRLIQLKGLGSGLSNNYYLNKVSHKFNMDDGYICESSFSNQFMPDEEAVQ